MFSKFFIDRPIFASVISIIIVIAGLICISQLSVEEYPNLNPPNISVSATYSGADAQTIADAVAAPLETAINGVEDMIYMTSSSNSAGTMNINVYFKTGTDPKLASVDVNNRVNSAVPMLPEEVRRFGVQVRQGGSGILSVVAFFDPTGGMDIVSLTNFVTVNVVEELKRVPGIAGAQVIGAKDYSMRIWLNPGLLEYFNLGISEVIAAINEQNSQYSIGKVGEVPMDESNPYVFNLKTEGRLKSTEQFGDIIIRSNEDGSSLKLKDIAQIELGAQTYSFSSLYNGVQSVPVMLNLQTGANALAAQDAVEKKLAELSKSFPGNIDYTVAYETTKFVKHSVKEVVHTLFEAMVLVTLVVYLFLGNFRATMIPMLAVPVSIIGTFIGMYAFGFSINLITLFGLILAIGIVVDDAIIVIENVERILEEDEDISVVEATKMAMEEITGAVVSIVLVLAAVFIPVSFLSGFVGIFQRQFALTIVISVAISGLVALTLTPALCALILKRERTKNSRFIDWFNRFFNKLTNKFTDTVAFVLKHVFLSLIIIAVILFATLILYRLVPGGFVPSEDKGNIFAATTLPTAATLQRTMEDVEYLNKELLADKDIKSVLSLVGYDILTSSLQENSATMFITLNPFEQRENKESSVFALTPKLMQKFYIEDRNSLTYFLVPPAIMGLSLSDGFEAYAQSLTGKSYSEISQDIQKVLALANERPELKNVKTTLVTTYPQYDIIVNREKAKMLDVSIQNLFNVLGATIGQYYVNDFNILGKTFKVNLRANAPFRSSIEDLKGIFVKTNSGSMVPINSIVEIKRALGPNNVERFNGYAAAKIMGEPQVGYSSAQAISAISEVFAQTFPTQYSLGWSGTSYEEVNSSGTSGLALIFGIVFVYLILAAQYERWLVPLAVLTAIPFSIFGAFLATYLRGLNNDIYLQIGLLLLVGLGAKNAILIVEFAMERIRHKDNAMHASVEAVRLRFRPIIMTSLAFTIGVLPLMFSSGAGAASRHALGTGVVGGMIGASTFALLFVPLFFYLLESANEKFYSKKGKKDAKDI